MIKINYYEAYSIMKSSYDIRFQMVHYALDNNISLAAEQFGTTPKTVRKWLTQVASREIVIYCKTYRYNFAFLQLGLILAYDLYSPYYVT